MIIIAVEGVDGVGKTTLINSYRDTLIYNKYRVFDIQLNMLNFSKLSKKEQIDHILFIRHNQIEEAITLLKKHPNTTIIFDRWYPSLFVYQKCEYLDNLTIEELNPYKFMVDHLIYLHGKSRLGIKDILELSNSTTSLSQQESLYEKALVSTKTHFSWQIIKHIVC